MKGQRPVIISSGDEGHDIKNWRCCGECIFWKGWTEEAGSYAGECYLMEDVEYEVTDEDAYCDRFEASARLAFVMKRDD